MRDTIKWKKKLSTGSMQCNICSAPKFEQKKLQNQEKTVVLRKSHSEKDEKQFSKDRKTGQAVF